MASPLALALAAFAGAASDEATFVDGQRRVARADLTGLKKAGNTDPLGLWSDGVTVWVVDISDQRLYAYDLASGARDARKEIDLSAVPVPTGVWSDGTTIWVLSHRGGAFAFDLATGHPDRRKHRPDIGTSTSQALWSDGETAWVGDGNGDQLLAYEWATERRVPDRDFRALDAAGNTDPLGLWSDGRTMWVSDTDERLYAYDMATRGRLPEKDLTAPRTSGNGWPAGIWSDGFAVWVADRTDDRVYVYGRLRPALDGLVLSDADIGAFHANRVDYVADVAPEVSTTTVTATALANLDLEILPADGDADTPGHQIDVSGLAAGGVVAVSVAVRDGTTGLSRTYNLRLIRPAPEGDATLAALSLSDVDFGAFDRYRRSYSAVVPYAVGETTVVATPAVGAAVARVLIDDADLDAAGHQVALAVGRNVVATRVRAADGVTERVYTVEVVRQARADDATLTALSVGDIDIGVFSRHVYDYVGAVAADAEDVTVRAEAAGDARFSIAPGDADAETDGHQVAMAVGVERLTVVVTVASLDGRTTQDYRVVLDRTAIGIPDANLRAAISRARSKEPASPLAAGDLAALRTLDLSRIVVTDLTGLEFAVNLRVLFLGPNRIADLSPLSRLPVSVRHALSPGVGNYTWREDQLWQPIGDVAAGERDKLGHGKGFMADGRLVTIRAVDGSKPQLAYSGEMTTRLAVVEVWDVSDPRKPDRVKVYRNRDTYRLREAHSVGLWNRGGRIVLAAQSHDGVAFFDVTEIRTRLTLLAELDIAGVEPGDYAGSWWLAVQAPYVYVAAVGAGLYVVDAADPRAPSLVRHSPTGALGGISPGSVFAVGNLLVLAEADGRGYATVDVSDPANPVLIEARDGATGYSHMFTAGRLFSSGGRGDPNRLYVHRVSHDGRIAYEGEAGLGLSEGGYGSYQDGHFLGGFSGQVAKFTVDPPAMVASGSSGYPKRDEEFAQPLGNLIFASDDHGTASTLIPHQAERDTRGPEVEWTHPPDGATGVAVTARVGVSMSDEVAAESLVPDSFRVRARGGKPVSGQLSVNQNNVNFFPDEALAEDTLYDVEVCGLADLVGNVGGCTTSTFTTGGSEAEPPSCRFGPLDGVEVGTRAVYEAAAVTGAPNLYTWTFGDGQELEPQASGRAEVTHALPGRYSATLTVSNEHGAASCGAVRIVYAPVSATPAVSSSSIIVVRTPPMCATSDGGLTPCEEGDDSLRRRAETDVYTANPDNGTVTRIDQNNVKVWETMVGDMPRTLAAGPDGGIWVTAQGAGAVVVLDREGEVVRTVDLGYGAAPHGIAFAPDGGAAYVTLEAEDELLRLSPEGQVTGRIAVGARPRGIAVSGDSQRILVTRFVSAFVDSDGAGDDDAVGEVYEVDASTFAVTRTHELAFDPGPDTESSGRGVPNYLSQVRISPDGRTAWIPSKKDNITRGQSRDGNDLDFETQTRTIVSQIDLKTNAEALGRRLDFNDRDLAQAMVFTPLGDAVVVAFEGSNVIEVWDATARARLSEIPVGRAPMGLAFGPDGRRLYVHNFLDRSVTVLNTGGLLDGTVNQPPRVATVSTVGEEALGPAVLRGKRIFYNAADARMNRDGYVSCASCHLDGGSDGMVWDRTQFGEGLRNTIDLRGRRGTDGGFVHWTANFDEIQDFEHDIRNAFGGAGFMADSDFNAGSRAVPLGEPKAGVSAELDDLAAYVVSLDRTPDSPHRADDGTLSAAGVAGRAVFDAKACARCHMGADFTDDGIHDVGTIRASSGAGLTGINTPTLKGLWLGAPYLHDGNASTLAEVLGNAVHMGAALTAEEKESLEAYLLQIDDSEPTPTVPPVADPSLRSLALSDVDIGTFAAETTSYTANVTYDVAMTTVSAAASAENTMVSITPPDADADADGHQVALAVGANEIAVTVTAADTTTRRTYTATVTRPNPPVATIAVSASPAEIEEGQTATVTVAITNDVTFVEERTLALQVSGVSASDYSLAPEPLTLPAGSSSASATLSAVLDDLEEAAETAQIAVLLDGESVGSAAVTITDAVPPPVPGIAGVPQVGGSLEATFEEAVPAEIRYQWLRGAGGEEISGAVGASYTAVEADEDEAVSVRVDLGNAAVAHASAATAPVWPAASNPPLHGRDEELLGATMTLGSSDAFPLWLAGYGRFEGVAFGSMDRLSFSVGDVEHELTVAMVNALGGFALQASPRIADVSGLVVYWNDYRIESLAPDNGSDPQFWVASTPQPKSEYGRYWRGASDGVQVALSIRRPGPEDDASLSGLTLSDVDIGAFDSEVTSYTAEVAFDVEMTTLEAVASDDRASIEIADSVGSTVGPQRTSRLSQGANEITVTVTAADQETTRTYAVTVTRLPPPWGTRLRSRDISLSGASTATGVWSDGSTLWVVTDRWEGLVQGYSLADGSRLAERDLELVGGYGYTTALWSDGSTLWAADYYGGVLGYRLSDGARLADKDLDGAVLSAAGNDNPGGLWSDGTTLWVADHIDGWVYAYLLSDGSRVSAEEFSVRTQQHHGMNPFGLWFGDGTVLASYWARGLVKAYRESDGSHLGSREIDTGSSGNDLPRGLWSDGSTLWVADEVDLKLYAYAVPVSVAASQGSVESGPFGPIPPSWAPAVPSASPGPPVFIPDAGLRSRLEAALGKAPGESIGTREMAAIETLNLDGAAPDLWALIGLTGLKRLSLRGNDLEDLSALSLLAGLRVLDIGENRIVDLGPLAALTGLESLRADGNAIRDLTPLAGLTSLRHLSLSDNEITDPLPLAGLTALVTLDLWANRVEDLLPRQGLPQADGGRAESPDDGQDAATCGLTTGGPWC